VEVRNHKLVGDDAITFVDTPNIGPGRLDPQYIVMHYTAGRSVASSVAWLADPAARASAHVVIGRAGEIVQLASFNKVAWHAGASRWRGVTGLNKYSIGIELDNAGVLERKGGRLQAWFGGDYSDSEAMSAIHQHEDRERFWHTFTELQIEVATRVVSIIADHYNISEVIGHDDISPGRKLDPGPAFPMKSFRSIAMGRRENDFEIFEAITQLNIRTGPGIAFEKLDRSPLPKGTRMKVLASEASWCAVEVPNVDNDPDIVGWVHGDFIRLSR